MSNSIWGKGVIAGETGPGEIPFVAENADPPEPTDRGVVLYFNAADHSLYGVTPDGIRLKFASGEVPVDEWYGPQTFSHAFRFPSIDTEFGNTEGSSNVFFGADDDPTKISAQFVQLDGSLVKMTVTKDEGWVAIFITDGGDLPLASGTYSVHSDLISFESESGWYPDGPDLAPPWGQTEGQPYIPDNGLPASYSVGGYAWEVSGFQSGYGSFVPTPSDDEFGTYNMEFSGTKDGGPVTLLLILSPNHVCQLVYVPGDGGSTVVLETSSWHLVTANEIRVALPTLEGFSISPDSGQ